MRAQLSPMSKKIKGAYTSIESLNNALKAALQRVEEEQAQRSKEVVELEARQNNLVKCVQGTESLVRSVKAGLSHEIKLIFQQQSPARGTSAHGC